MPDQPSTELAVIAPTELVVPGTGELVSLDDAPAVARALDAVREYKRTLDDARAVLENALVREATRQGTKTLRLGTVTATVGSDSDVEWDVSLLAGLIDLGLPEERYNQLVHAEVTYKVDGRVAREVAGANDEYAAVIAKAKGRRPKRPYVKVEAA